MNCMETRALVEDALDESLSGNQRRALDLHLSRCEKCREFFAAEREEHCRWFQAMNEPQSRRRLPDGFADDFVAAMANANVAPRKRWKFARLFRRIAAVLAAMLLFAGLSYAAVVAVVDGGWQKEGTSADSVAVLPENIGSGDGSSPVLPVSGGNELQIKINSPTSGQQTGDVNMSKAKTAAAVLSVAMSAAPLAASYNSLAPHTNTENTDFWDTRNYDVEPESSAIGVCSASLNRLVRTEAVSENVVQSFRRIGVTGMVITIR